MSARYEKLFAKNGDIRLWCEAWGDDGEPACLFIGGAGAVSTFWPEDFCAGLAELGWRVIRYDHRDAGLSSFVDFAADPYSLDELVEDALAVMNRFGVEKTHVVGHSMGGFIAQLLAVKQRHRVLSLTSISSHTAAPDIPQPPASTWEIMLANRPEGDLSEDLPGYMNIWRFMNGSADFDEQMARDYTSAIYQRNPATLPADNHVAIQQGMADLTALLKNLAVSALVIHGREDPLVPVGGGVMTAEAIPGAMLNILDQVGHMFFHKTIWQEIANALVNHFRAAQSHLA